MTNAAAPRRGLREWIVRSLILMAGLTVAHFGVTLFLLSDLGSDPFNVLVQGVYRRLSGLAFLTHGRTHMGISLLIILVLLLTDRHYVKIGTVLCMVCGGPIIDLFTLLLGPLLGGLSSLPARVLMLAAGCVILACGMTIVIKSDAGTGPNDLVGVVLSDKLRTKFSLTRLAVDALFALSGYLLGGLVGLGTVICVALVGPVAGFFLPISERLVDRLLRRFCPDAVTG